MTETEKIVRIFHESWDMRDPDRGATVITEDCQFEDIARGERQIGPEAYKHDYYRWREAFPVGYVFYHPHIDKYSKDFKSIARDCGIEDISLHKLRHTAATQMLASGISLEYVQEILGHE